MISFPYFPSPSYCYHPLRAGTSFEVAAFGTRPFVSSSRNKIGHLADAPRTSGAVRSEVSHVGGRSSPIPTGPFFVLEPRSYAGGILGTLPHRVDEVFFGTPGRITLISPAVGLLPPWPRMQPRGKLPYVTVSEEAHDERRTHQPAQC